LDTNDAEEKLPWPGGWRTAYVVVLGWLAVQVVGYYLFWMFYS